MSNTKTSRINNNSLSIVGHDSAAKNAGTNPQAIAQALKTYEIPVGPGSYNLPDLLNKPQVSARNRNGPCPTIGVPRPRLAVNPETRSAIPSVAATTSNERPTIGPTTDPTTIPTPFAISLINPNMITY